jgi:hypothetical protein
VVSFEIAKDSSFVFALISSVCMVMVICIPSVDRVKVPPVIGSDDPPVDVDCTFSVWTQFTV